MQIQGRHLLSGFCKKHSNAQSPFKKWVTVVEEVEWQTPADVKATFPSVSFVKTTTVFNIGGNNFRLLSHILFNKETVVIYKILVHADYDRLTIT